MALLLCRSVRSLLGSLIGGILACSLCSAMLGYSGLATTSPATPAPNKKPRSGTAPAANKKVTGSASRNANGASLQPPSTKLAASVPVAVCHLDHWLCEIPLGNKALCLFPSPQGQPCSPPVLALSSCPVRAGPPPPPNPVFESRASAASAIDVATVLGKAAPFTLTALDTNTLVLTRAAGKTGSTDNTVLNRLIQIWLPLVLTAKSTASFDFEVPHARSLGDPAASITALGSPWFAAQNAGGGRIRITVSGSPSCTDLQAFLDAVHRLAWSPGSESPVARVYSLDAPTAASLVNATAAPAPSAGQDDQTDSASPGAATGTDKQAAPSTSAGAGGSQNANQSEGSSPGGDSTSKTKSKGASSSSKGGGLPPRTAVRRRPAPARARVLTANPRHKSRLPRQQQAT